MQKIRILEQLFVQRRPTSGLLAYARRKFPNRLRRLTLELGLPTKQIVYHMFVSSKVRTCPACGKISAFRTLNIGYIMCCSLACSRTPGVYALRLHKTEQTFIKNYGATHHMKTSGTKRKFKRTMRRRYGVDNALESPEIIRHMKAGIKSRWGVDHPMHNAEVKNRVEETNLRRYGTKCSFGARSVQKKSRATNLLRYGVEYALENADVQRKRLATLRQNYGVDQPMQSLTIRRRKEATMISRYGVKHPMQNSAILNYAQSQMLKASDVTYRGKTYFALIGSYEPKVLMKLVDRGYRVASRCTLTFSYWCRNSKRQRVYHPDLYVGKGGRRYVVEVKSTYTAGICSKIPDARFYNLVDKATSVVSAGYNFKLVILVNDKMQVFSGVPRWEDVKRINP